LRLETTAPSVNPSTADATVSATSCGSPPAERVPIAASVGPIVTSATGAKSKLSPLARSSVAMPSVAARVTSGSFAAPAAMNSGKEVHGPVSALSRWTVPPSLSTERIAGQSRPRSACASCTASEVATTWSRESMLSENSTSPPRWYCVSSSAAAAGSVPG
jgi:hypothetical protein